MAAVEFQRCEVDLKPIAMASSIYQDSHGIAMVCHGSSSYGWSIRGSPVWRRKYPFSNGDLRDSASVLYNYLEAIRELKTHVPTRPNTSQHVQTFRSFRARLSNRIQRCLLFHLTAQAAQSSPHFHRSGIHCGENPMGRFALHFRWDHVWRHVGTVGTVGTANLAIWFPSIAWTFGQTAT